MNTYSGDTSRFSTLDPYPGWTLRFRTYWDPVVLENGDSLTFAGDLPGGVPDTVRGDGPLEIDVTFDMDGLFYLLPGGTEVAIDPEKVEYHQD
jgi:hypothetical protein